MNVHSWSMAHPVITELNELHEANEHVLRQNERSDTFLARAGRGRGVNWCNLLCGRRNKIQCQQIITTPETLPTGMCQTFVLPQYSCYITHTAQLPVSQRTTAPPEKGFVAVGARSRSQSAVWPRQSHRSITSDEAKSTQSTTIRHQLVRVCIVYI